MFQDLRYAFRTLSRRPLATSVAAITLGLGIGGATAVFGVVEAVVLRPLPFPEADRLVRIWELTRGGDRFSFSAPNYLDLRDQARTLAPIAAYADVGASAVLADGGEPQRISAVPISASLPDALGVSAQVGRVFSADEDRPGIGSRSVVLSDGLWRRRFGADPGILGRSLTLDGNSYLVIGVMPARFDFPGGADAWVPLAADPRSDRGDKSLAVIGRLAPGATLAQARGELREIARRTAAAHPEFNAGWSAEAIPFSEWIVAPRFRDAAWVLAGAAGVLLLLACANVANLLVAGAAARKAELRVRAALGAARGRLIRQLLTEAAVLAAAGTAAGVLFASWFVAAIHVVGVDRIPRLDALQMSAPAWRGVCGTVRTPLGSRFTGETHRVGPERSSASRETFATCSSKPSRRPCSSCRTLRWPSHR